MPDAANGAGDSEGAREGGTVEDGQEPAGTGEPVTERARIAGVEAGVAAGLVPSAEAVARPAAETVADAPVSAGGDPAPSVPSATVGGRDARLR